MIKKIKIKSWWLATAFVLASPIVFELSFREDIAKYKEDKSTFESLTVDVESFKKIVHPERIVRKHQQEYTDEFLTYVGDKYGKKNFKIKSAEISGGLFKVKVTVKPSVTSCLFRKQSGMSGKFVHVVDINKDCAREHISYVFASF